MNKLTSPSRRLPGRLLKLKAIIFLFIVLLLTTLLFSSCANAGSEANAEANLSCELSVLDHVGEVIPPHSAAFSRGDSVLDILLSAVRDAGLQIEYTGAGGLAYVQGINDLYEFDEGPESGWVYTVNGEEIFESAGAYKPKDGDVIVWQYIIVSSTR